MLLKNGMLLIIKKYHPINYKKYHPLYKQNSMVSEEKCHAPQKKA